MIRLISLISGLVFLPLSLVFAQDYSKFAAYLQKNTQNVLVLNFGNHDESVNPKFMSLDEVIRNQRENGLEKAPIITCGATHNVSINLCSIVFQDMCGNYMGEASISISSYEMASRLEKPTSQGFSKIIAKFETVAIPAIGCGNGPPD